MMFIERNIYTTCILHLNVLYSHNEFLYLHVESFLQLHHNKTYLYAKWSVSNTHIKTNHLKAVLTVISVSQ